MYDINSGLTFWFCIKLWIRNKIINNKNFVNVHRFEESSSNEFAGHKVSWQICNEMSQYSKKTKIQKRKVLHFLLVFTKDSLDLWFSGETSNGVSALCRDLRLLSFVIVHHKVSGSYISRRVWPRITEFHRDIHTHQRKTSPANSRIIQPPFELESPNFKWTSNSPNLEPYRIWRHWLRLIGSKWKNDWKWSLRFSGAMFCLAQPIRRLLAIINSSEKKELAAEQLWHFTPY